MAQSRSNSVFSALGLPDTIASKVREIQQLYLSDDLPWVVGYSGGKDSTAVLQLVWVAVESLEEGQRTKDIHVISTDTLVENPVVASWVSQSLERMQAAAHERRLPIRPHRLTPTIRDSFWVSLIGKGYPAPRHKFRWCTSRLKINPSNHFIQTVLQSHGQTILVLGTRKAESSARAHRMNEAEQKRVRDLLSPNTSLPNSYVYTPIEDWTDDDVWTFLLSKESQGNPWGNDNTDLLNMYQGASADGECPVQLDTSTPSCGSSRFGCWVCTLVDEDKSMGAMIQNDEEKEWMLPLLELRNELGVKDDSHLRDFRRMHGGVQLYNDAPIHGPYTQEARERWLGKLLDAQAWIRGHGPQDARSLELVTLEELREIRRIWVLEKHELEDSLPGIYERCTGTRYPDGPVDDRSPFGLPELQLLRDCCGRPLLYEMIREMLDAEQRFRTMNNRMGLFPALEKAIVRSFYESAEDAANLARRKRDMARAAQSGGHQLLFEFAQGSDATGGDEAGSEAGEQ